MKEFDELVGVVARLRSKKGCPWDRKQTHLTLKPYIIEEAYETLGAIDSRDPEKLRDELGDVLLQVVLHSQIASESKEFRVEDVAVSITEKMKRRHPHVFGKKKVSGVEEIWKNWEEIKKGEAEYVSILDTVPGALPALYRAEKVQKKAARVGFDWDNIAGAWSKVTEELAEVKQLLSSPKKNRKRIEEEIGDLLFSIVNVSRKLDLNAEESLQGAIKKFAKRFAYIEKHSGNKKRKLTEMTLKEMDVLWEKAKRAGAKSRRPKMV